MEELQRRHATGEFSGSEYVQAEGMNDWQPLQLVLQLGYIQSPPSSSPPPQGRTNMNLVWGIVILGILCVVFFVILIAWNVKHAIGIMTQQQQQQHSSVNLYQPRPEAMAASMRPVVWNTNTLTVVDARTRAREFRIREWLEGYQQRGRRDPEGDGEVVEFLQTWIARNYGGEAATNRMSLSRESDKLAADPQCTDPLVLTVVANETTDRAAAIERFQRALAAYPASAHRAYPQFYALVILARYYDTPSDHVTTLDSSALELLPKCFSDGSFTDIDQQEIAEIFVNGWGNDFFSRNADAVCKIANDAGPRFHWVALVLGGENERTKAWQARDNGWTQKDRKTFYADMTIAETNFTEAWNLETNFPLAPAAMIQVSLGNSDITKMRTWFDRATAAQIDYPDAWAQMLWGFNPDCLGNEGCMLAFGKAAVESGRFDTDVPYKLVDCIKAAESEMNLQPGHHLFGRSDIWPELEKMYSGYLSEPAQSRERDKWRSSYAAVAFFAGKDDVAREQLQALNWNPDFRTMAEWKIDPVVWPLDVAARTGPLGKKISMAEILFQSGDKSGALAQYTTLSSTPGADDRTKQFIHYRLMMLNGKYPIEAQLQQ